MCGQPPRHLQAATNRYAPDLQIWRFGCRSVQAHMSRFGLMILMCVCAGCSSTARDLGTDATTLVSVVPATAPPEASPVVPATDPSEPSTGACSPDNDPLSVAKTFILAAETSDQATIARCIYPAAGLGSDLIAIAASGGWMLDQVRPVQRNSKLKVGPDSVGFDFPAPPQSRGTFIDSAGQSQALGPDFQSGVQIAVTLEPNGLRYVTDILGYASG
jgi:hypothetical protein